MMLTMLEDIHPPDGELVRLLDGELAAAERTRAEDHVNRCSACRERLHRLERRSTRLTALLQESDWDTPAVSPAFLAELERKHARAPRMRSRVVERPWLRAAAIIAVVLGIGLVASPARAWIADWVAAQWAALTLDQQPAASEKPGPAPRQAASTRVQFRIEGDELSVEIATRQAGGAITLRTGEGSLVSAEVIGGGAGADLLVLPDGLRIANTAESTAEYRMVVPAQVRRVRVRIGDGPEIVLTAAELTGGKRLELSRETP